MKKSIRGDYMENSKLSSRTSLPVIVILLLFILASVEPPVSLPFPFPRTTWGIMKLGLLLFVSLSLARIWIKEKDYFYKNRRVFFAPLLFLTANVMSMFASIDLNSSIELLIILLMGLSFYFLGVYFFKKNDEVKLFIQVILFLTIFSGVLNLLLLFSYYFEGINFIGDFFGKIFPVESLMRFMGDLDRKRLQTFWFVEFSFPILLYFVFSSPDEYRGKKRRPTPMLHRGRTSFFGRFLTLSLFGLFLSTVGIMLANNRYQFITMFFGIFMFILLNKKDIRRRSYSKFLIPIFSVFILIGVLASNFFLGNNLFERVLLSNYRRDIKPLESRIYYLNQAWKMFTSLPILGVGLRNFFYYFPPEQEFFTDPLWKVHEESAFYSLEPHNIFFQTIAETGMIGLMALLILIITFIKQDITLIRHCQGRDLMILFSAISLSSWCFLVDEQFTVINDSLAAQIYFWFTRGILAAFHLKYAPGKETLEKSNKKKKILFVVETWNRFGGVEREIPLIKDVLSKDFVSTTFVLPAKRHWHPQVFFSLWIKLLQERPDFLMSFCEYSNLVCGLVSILNPFPAKLIVNEHNDSGAMFITQRFKYIKKQLIRLIYNLMASKVVVVSETIRRKLIQDFQINPNQIEVIYPSIDLQKIKKLKKEKPKFYSGIGKNKYIIAVGRLSPEKRFSYLISVFNKLVKKKKNLKLLIVGEGSEKNKLQNQIRNFKLTESVYLLGGTINPFPYIKNAVALIITSSSEGFPHIALESRACGAPVVSVNFDTARKMIKDKKNGIIVGMNDMEVLQKSILKLINDDAYRRKIALRAQQGLEKYSIKGNTKKYKDLFMKLL